MRRSVRAPRARASGRSVDRALPVGVDAGGPGVVLGHRAGDRGDHHERDVGVAIADLVEEAVDGRDERALAHRVGVHDVDAELEADEVGRLLPDHAGGERVELALPGEGEALQVDPARRAATTGHTPVGRWPRGSARSSCRSGPSGARRSARAAARRRRRAAR